MTDTIVSEFSGIANWFDVFCLGIFIGAGSVIISMYFVKLIELVVGRHERERYLKLGRAVEEMKRKLQKDMGYQDDTTRRS